MGPKNKPSRPTMPPNQPPPPTREERRQRSQRNLIVEGLQIVQGTLTAVTAAAATVNPSNAIYGVAAKGVLELVTWSVNRFWKT